MPFKTKSERKCCDEYDGTHNEVLTPHLKIQYGKLICSHCGKFIQWMRKPDNEKANQRVMTLIENFITKNGDDITEKQLSFLKNIKNVYRPSISQKNYVEGIFSKFGIISPYEL